MTKLESFIGNALIARSYQLSMYANISDSPLCSCVVQVTAGYDSLKVMWLASENAIRQQFMKPSLHIC